MKPYITCQMDTTVDGRMDGQALRAVQEGTEYESTGFRLNGDAWISGRETMQQHYAEQGAFFMQDKHPSRKVEHVRSDA